MRQNSNPWNRLKLQDYEMHMGHENVLQLQVLNGIIREQLQTVYMCEASGLTVSILGVTNGNGLEHIEPAKVKRIIGIDINEDFLDVCRKRFLNLKERLELYRLDLTEEKSLAAQILADSDLILANLILEHIHLSNFLEIVRQLEKKSRILSCVIQQNEEDSLLSKSGYESAFYELLPNIEEIDRAKIVQSLSEIGFRLEFEKVYPLPNRKVLLRLDFLGE